MATTNRKRAGRRSFFSDGELQAEERARVRALLARDALTQDHFDAAQVAQMVGLEKRTILNLVRDTDEFPNAWKPSHNRVRIPAGDVAAFKLRRRVQP